MGNIETNTISQELMMGFLKQYCPMKRVKLNNKSRKWTQALIIDGVFMKNKTIFHPIDKTDVTIMMTDLYNVLYNVFSFKHEDIVITISRYLKIDY